MVPHLNYAAIGNGRVLALVGPDTSIDWLCLPRFDSPSVFGRILDEERGGSFGFDFDEPALMSARYVVNTNVLRTEVEVGDGRFEMFDFAPRVPRGLTFDAPLEVHRLLRPLSGAPRMRVRFDPRPDYGRAAPRVLPMPRGLEVRGGALPLYLRTNLPTDYVTSSRPFRLDQPVHFVVSGARPADADMTAEIDHLLQMTVEGWRQWAKSCALPSFYPEVVLRSALCLKLHAYVDTGAIIAAATTSIPEALDSERTWDYRYCWLRDSAFVVEALRRLSQLSEGEHFVRFLRDVADSGPLQPIYGIGGERDLVELQLEHWKGYGGRGPVRIGNAAYNQAQHDVYGEMVLCLETLYSDPRIVSRDESLMSLVEPFVNEAIARARQDDTGLWEYRTSSAQHTFSQVLGWVAAARGADVADREGRYEQSRRWRAWAGAEREYILEHAYNANLGYFTHVLDGFHPDASNLLLPTFGIIEPTDPRFVSTVRAYERLLAPDGFMLRYRHTDDFGDTTSAFSICSFWWAEALAMIGRTDDAVKLFNRLLKHANPFCLFSEDIEPTTGRLLGNFPQAYTHVGLIHAAITIGEILEAKHGSFRAWASWTKSRRD
ncbi:MAG TPA: glycoside hydrolase family 15 protein [Vicinamibacterales bacterium]